MVFVVAEITHNKKMEFLVHMCNALIIKYTSNPRKVHFSESQASQITRFVGTTRGPPGSCRLQIGPMLAPWTLLSGTLPYSEHRGHVTFPISRVLLMVISKNAAKFEMKYNYIRFHEKLRLILPIAVNKSQNLTCRLEVEMRLFTLNNSLLHFAIINLP